MLTCENLLFRLPNRDDIDALCVLKNNEKASLLLGGIHHHYTLMDIERWIEFHNNNPEEVLYVIEDISVGRLIGHVGLYKINQFAKKTEYGILIADDNSRGKGYGTICTKTMVEYAFKELGMNKVTAEVLCENVPSIAMFKKCGFSIDGRLRDEVYKNGRYYDVFVLSILANEFFK